MLFLYSRTKSIFDRHELLGLITLGTVTVIPQTLGEADTLKFWRNLTRAELRVAIERLVQLKMAGRRYDYWPFSEPLSVQMRVYILDEVVNKSLLRVRYQRMAIEEIQKGLLNDSDVKAMSDVKQTAIQVCLDEINMVLHCRNVARRREGCYLAMYMLKLLVE